MSDAITGDLADDYGSIGVGDVSPPKDSPYSFDLDKWLGYAEKGVEIFNKVKPAIQNQNTGTVPVPAQSRPPTAANPVSTDNTKTILLVGGGIVAIVVLAMVLKR